MVLQISTFLSAHVYHNLFVLACYVLYLLFVISWYQSCVPWNKFNKTGGIHFLKLRSYLKCRSLVWLTYFLWVQVLSILIQKSEITYSIEMCFPSLKIQKSSQNNLFNWSQVLSNFAKCTRRMAWCGNNFKTKNLFFSIIAIALNHRRSKLE